MTEASPKTDPLQGTSALSCLLAIAMAGIFAIVFGIAYLLPLARLMQSMQ